MSDGADLLSAWMQTPMNIISFRVNLLRRIKALPLFEALVPC